ncbi:MAG: hypothetical protein IT379_24805, partial [Deltaproteobacteria bacterium]|nr:hypothetical protein [Deltaproteobacteria bacterium]
MRAARVVRHSSLLGAITASLVACVAGPQPEPPGDPSEAGVAAARDSGRAPPDVGSSAPPPAPPPEPDAGADGLDEGGVTPVPM